MLAIIITRNNACKSAKSSRAVYGKKAAEAGILHCVARSAEAQRSSWDGGTACGH